MIPFTFRFPFPSFFCLPCDVPSQLQHDVSHNTYRVNEVGLPTSANLSAPAGVSSSAGGLVNIGINLNHDIVVIFITRLSQSIPELLDHRRFLSLRLDETSMSCFLVDFHPLGVVGFGRRWVKDTSVNTIVGSNGLRSSDGDCVFGIMGTVPGGMLCSIASRTLRLE